MSDKLKQFEHATGEGFAPPRIEPAWQWMEREIVLDNTSARQGAYSTVFTLMVRFICFWFQNIMTRRIVMMVSAQSAKTQIAINLLLWCIDQDPAPAMWVTATKDNVKEFAKKRLYTAMENCKPVLDKSPQTRGEWTASLVQYDTMNLMLRGTNSRIGLQSDPVRRIFCDERREYKTGAIHLLRKRLRTFYNSLEISMGTAGKKNDDLHTDWLDGSQTFCHWNCPKCQHSQSFRFGQDESVLHPNARTQGGVVWPTNEETKPNGIWNWEKVKEHTRYQCESCGDLFHNSQKFDLLSTMHEFHRNPSALPKHYSIHWNALYMPWEDCSWGDIAVEFLKAVESMKRGDIEPMIAFVTETLGEPWEPQASKKQQADLQQRRGKYKMGQCWMDAKDPTKMEENTGLIMTFDRQLTYLAYVVRQWRNVGQSRLIEYGRVPALDDLRKKQFDLKIFDSCVWGDDHGPNTADFRKQALIWGWGILIGEDFKHFNISRKEDGQDKSFRQGWRETNLDPGVGTVNQGIATKEAYLWSNPWFKDRLFFYFVRGRNAPLWEIPEDTTAQYFQEMTANEYREKTLTNGSIENYWHETGPDHLADCELEQLVVADIGGLTRIVQPASSADKSS